MYPFLSQETASYDLLDKMFREPEPRFVCSKLTQLAHIDAETLHPETIQELFVIKTLAPQDLNQQDN